MAASRRPTTQARLPLADHPTFAARERAAAHGGDILKTSMAIFAGVQK
jgi:hypothetical protein